MITSVPHPSVAPRLYRRIGVGRCDTFSPGHRARWAALASIALAALTACTPADRMSASGEELAALSEQAQSLSAQGDHAAARQAYLSMVRRAPPTARQRYRILAAREAGRGGRNRRALSELEAMDPGEQWFGLWSLAVSESERALSGADAAYQRLAPLDPRRFPELAGELLKARSELLFALNRPSEALQDLTLLGAGFAAEDTDSAGFTWSLLKDYGARLTTDGVDGVALGWIELAVLSETLQADPTEAGAALTAWQEQFPQHPAIGLLDSAVIPGICRAARRPQRMAMLLPGPQRYEAAQNSLRDGFMAARFALQSSCPGPEVTFYEVADPPDAARQWRQAVEDGADIVVGPLLPDSVESVAGIAGAHPTLALNRLRAGAAPAGFEEFALSPEHESRQAARHALDEGLRRALVLHPRNEWGRRIVRSFADEYRDGGGEIIAQEQYSLTAVDYSDQITRLLKIGASNRRHQALQGRLGRRLNFEPRRRQDADLAFVVARAAQGQLLVPQLRYNYSGDLPIYAIQDIFDPGHPDNRDLNGVEMPALPLLADQHSQAANGELSSGRLVSAGLNLALFAMGYDSFKLALALFGGPDDLNGGIDGLTGTVSRDPDGQLKRKLAWTRIEQGQLTAVPKKQ